MGLTSAEKEKVKRVIPKSSQKVLDAAISRLYIAYPDPQQWTYTGLSGAIVLVDDLVGHTFFLKLVDVNGHRGVLWDQELYVDFQYNQDRSFFHSFELEECLAGLLFDDTSDSSHFYKRVVNREKHGSKKTVQNKQAIALKKKPEVRAPGPRGELNTTAIGEQRIRRTTHVLYYDDQPPPEWRSLYKELANAGITEDMIADNKAFIKDYIRQQGGALVGLEPPVPRKYQHGKPEVPSSPMSFTPSVRKKAPPPPPPAAMFSESASTPSEVTRENTPDISPSMTESSSMEQTPDPDPQSQARGSFHRVPPPLNTPVHRVPPPLNNAIPPPPSTQAERPNPPQLPPQSRPTPPLPTQTRPIPTPPSRGSLPPPPTRGNIPSPASSRGPVPPPPPRAMGQQLPQTQGRAPPPAPPPRRGPAPPAPPTRASRAVPPPPPSRQPQAIQYQQQQQPQYSQQQLYQEPQQFTPVPPPLPRSNTVPAAPQFPQAAQGVPPPPPFPTQSNAPPPPPFPTQSNAPPPPPQVGQPSNAPPLASVDGDRDALLASIRGAGLGSLKKVDKSQLDRPSVLLQEQRGEAPPPSAGGVPGGSLADALAAALNQRKAKVSHSDNESDGEEW